MKTPTAVQFQQLILSSFCFDGYDLDTEPKTDQQKTVEAAKILRKELGWMSDQGYTDEEICLYWLQGLASACTILFMNSDILAWWEEQTGEKLKASKYEDRALEKYWPKVANCLAIMINRAERGDKV